MFIYSSLSLIYTVDKCLHLASRAAHCKVPSCTGQGSAPKLWAELWTWFLNSFGGGGTRLNWGSLSHRKWRVACRVTWVCCFWHVDGGLHEVCVGYMTEHWVAPQQSLMMATPDLVMDGLLGGGSGICLLGFGGSCSKERGETRSSHGGSEQYSRPSLPPDCVFV